MRRTQYSGFVEVYNCLTVLESNVELLVILTVRTVLKVPFEKPASPIPFRHSGTPAQNWVNLITLYQAQKFTWRSLLNFRIGRLLL